MSDLKTNDSISNYGYTPAIEEVESYSMTNIHSSDIVNLNTEDDVDTKETNDYEYNDESSNSKSFGDETQTRENNMDRGRELVNSNNYIKNCVSTHQQNTRIDAPVLYNDIWKRQSFMYTKEPANQLDAFKLDAIFCWICRVFGFFNI